MTGKGPGRRGRTASTIGEQEEGDAATRFNKRDFFVQKIKKQALACKDQTFAGLSIVQLRSRLDTLQVNADKLEGEHLRLMGETADPAEIKALEDVNDEIDEEITSTRDIILTRISELQPEQTGQSSQQPQQVKVEVKNIDASGNVSNSWGTFDGDLSKWRAFRDGFKAAVHKNTGIAESHKLRHLLRTLKGAAAQAVGTFTLEDANYKIALNRVYALYEDDYLIVQTLLRKLFSLPRMNEATNVGLRAIIDTVRECLKQLGDFVSTENWDPIIVHLVIERLDCQTYDQWQVMWTRDNAKPVQIDSAEGEADEANDDATARSSTYKSPTWLELETFLENRARNLVHKMQRESDERNANTSRERKSSANNGNMSNANRRRQLPPLGNVSASTGAVSRPNREGAPICKLCAGRHTLYRCKDFLGLSFGGRRIRIQQWGLCENCLRETHSTSECLDEPCRRCKNGQMHNSIICPTAEAENRTTLLVRETSSYSRDRQQNRGRGRGASNARDSRVEVLSNVSSDNQDSHSEQSGSDTEGRRRKRDASSGPLSAPKRK